MWRISLGGTFVLQVFQFVLAPVRCSGRKRSHAQCDCFNEYVDNGSVYWKFTRVRAEQRTGKIGGQTRKSCQTSETTQT